MVKNTAGGNRHKKFARKHTTAKSNNKLRVSDDEGEVYAIVTKMLGNNMFHCVGIDDVTRLGHIRGKFTGRGKRDNFVSMGIWVLIGLREWANNDDKTKPSTKNSTQADLLEVYTATDKERLIDSVSANWSVLINNDASKETSGIKDNSETFAFATDKDIERDKLVAAIKSETTQKLSLITKTDISDDESCDEIDIEDI